jgi:hypothetical protein
MMESLFVNITNQTTKAADAAQSAFLSCNDVAAITGNPPWAWAFGEGAGAGNGRYFIPCVQRDWSTGWGFREVSRRRYYCWLFLRTSMAVHLIPSDVFFCLTLRRVSAIA